MKNILSIWSVTKIVLNTIIKYVFTREVSFIIVILFWKNGPSSASFSFIFGLFWTNITILTSNKCEKCPSSIWCWDSNLQPSEHESPPITTRPGVIIVIHDMPKSYQFIPPEDMNVHEEKHQYVHSNIYFLFLFISIFYSLILIILIYCCWLSRTYFQS